MKEKTFLRLLLILTTLLFVACSKGPNNEKLKEQVQSKLNSFQDSLFSIEDFSRRGSYTYDQEGPKLLVYFKSRVKLNSDYKFNNWNKLGSNSLIELVGATPAGILGVKPEGNKAGDVLTIYGSQNFKDANGEWVLAPAQFGKQAEVQGGKKFVTDIEAEENLDLNSLPSHRRYIQRLILLSKELQKAPESLDFFEKSLRKLLVATEIKADLSKGFSGIASGEQGGEYHLLGRAIDKLLDKNKLQYKAYSTFGSFHNIELVQAGDLKFGIAQGDILTLKKNENPRLRGVLALFPEAIQVVSLASSEIKDFRDLKGKKVDIGVPSGRQWNALQVLEAHGMNRSDLVAREQSLPEALDDLKTEQVDAVIFTGAYPFSLLRQFAKANPIRLIDLDPKAVQSLMGKGKIKLSVASKTYPGQREVYETVGTTAVLFSSSDIAANEVMELLKSLFSQQKKLAQITEKGLAFSRETWNSGISLPIHEGASKYFK